MEFNDEKFNELKHYIEMALFDIAANMTPQSNDQKASLIARFLLDKGYVRLTDDLTIIPKQQLEHLATYSRNKRHLYTIDNIDAFKEMGKETTKIYLENWSNLGPALQKTIQELVETGESNITIITKDEDNK